MEKIIKKAIEGGLKEGKDWEFVSANRMWLTWLDGNRTITNIPIQMYLMSSDFWQALSKSCGWVKFSGSAGVLSEEEIELWKFYALRFHELNLTEGWNKAVAYLQEVTQ